MKRYTITEIDQMRKDVRRLHRLTYYTNIVWSSPSDLGINQGQCSANRKTPEQIQAVNSLIEEILRTYLLNSVKPEALHALALKQKWATGFDESYGQ
jgi:hypothetical protein